MLWKVSAPAAALVLVCSLVLLAAETAAAAAPGETGLFRPITFASEAAAVPEASLRHRLVRPDFDRLGTATVGDADTLVLNLFEELQVRGRVARHKTHPSGTETWSGPLDNVPDGRFDLAVRDNVLVGSVVIDERLFEIRPAAADVADSADVHVITEQPMQAMPDAPAITADTEPAAASGQTATAGQFTGCDDPSRIDVMIVYSPAARNTQGGTAAIEALAQLAIDKANEAYDNSLIDLELQLVHTAEVAYDETTAAEYSDHLYRLQDPADGYMDEVHSLRDQYSADLVSMFVNDSYYFGLGFLGGDEDDAFTVVWRGAAVKWLSFAHEVGHNFGCDHNRPYATYPVEPYAYGHLFQGQSGTTFVTVMAKGGSRIPYFSNPNVLYDGVPTGVPLDAAEPAYNAFMITNAKPVVTNYRLGMVDCNSNGIDDAEDIAQGTSLDANGNGLPDECERRLYVNAAAASGGDGESWATAIDDFGMALEQITPCSRITEVWVAAGEYKPALPGGDRSVSFIIPNGVAVYGGFAGYEDSLAERDWVANETILSGDLNGDDQADFVNYSDNSCHVVQILSNDICTTLDGITIRGGNADETTCSNYGGGGVRAGTSSVSIEHCRITECRAGGGGGMSIGDALPGSHVKDCVLDGNRTTYSSGALSMVGAPLHLNECLFAGNEAGTDAGALGIYHVEAAPRVQGCVFIGNVAGRDGGAVCLYNSSMDLVECEFTRNTASQVGGGFLAEMSHIRIHNSLFQGNSGIQAGAAYLSAGSTGTSAVVVNTTFVGNHSTYSAGTVFTAGAVAEFYDCSWSANRAGNGKGSVIYTTTSGLTTISNSIVWGNDFALNAIYGGSTPAVISYSDFEGGYSDTGNINSDPLFTRTPSPGPDATWGTEDDDYGDLSLQSDSLCIDAGDTASIPADALDLDGDGDTAEPTPFDLAGGRRVFGPAVDMGAYEYRDLTIDTDFNDDGFVDGEDFDLFQACASGPKVPAGANCLNRDLDFDDDVDQSDFGIFQACLAGPDVPPDPACVD